jgi:hypothetical protein
MEACVMFSRSWLRPLKRASQVILTKKNRHRSWRRQPAGGKLILEWLEDRLAPATVTVNTTADDPTATNTTALTLRDAITLVNNGGNPQSLGQSSMPPPGLASQINTTNPFGTDDTIVFNIPTNDGGYNSTTRTFTINVGASLPLISNPVFINGFSQPGSSANTLPNQGTGAGDDAFQNIILDGSSIGSQGDGLTISASGGTVQGLVIQNFYNDIHLTTNGNNLIAGNYLTNAFQGVFVDDVPNNIIGGTTPGARNVFGNNNRGITILGAGATGNQVQGDYIGTDGSTVLNGTPSFPNSAAVGIFIYGANNIVGGTSDGAGNVIASPDRGIQAGLESSNPGNCNLVEGNYIGLNAAGTAVLQGVGVTGFGTGVALAGGTGTLTVGGTIPSARNVISGWQLQVAMNFSPGPGTRDEVEGNYIGTNAAGSAAADPDAITRITQYGSVEGIEGCPNGVISDNLISGLGTALNLNELTKVQGNLIGTDWTGTQAIHNGVGVIVGGGVLGASNDLIGGTTPGAGNTIAFNDGPAVEVKGAGNAIEGNSIYGNNDMNGHTGPAIDNLGQDGDSLATLVDTNWPGGPFTGTDNVPFSGLTLTQSSSTLYYSGTLGTPSDPGLPNTRYLVNLAAVSSDGKYWGSDYTYLTTDSSGQATFANISFPAPWGTSNTPGTPSASEWVAHSLGNHEQNYPVLTSASSSGSSVTISGTFNSTPGHTYRLEFFSNSSSGQANPGDPTDTNLYGEGQTYIGSAEVTTDNNGYPVSSPDGSAVINADQSFAVTLPTPVLAGQDYLTATATDVTAGQVGYDDTSEFSPDFTIPAANQAPVTTPNLQNLIAAVTPGGGITPGGGLRTVFLQAGPDLTEDTVISAVNGLTAPSVPVTITLDLNGGTYDDTTVSPPHNVTLVINGASGTNTFVGHSPAFTVTGGNVIVKNVTFTTATDAPTILVAGGSLTLRNDVVQSSTGFSDPAIALTGGNLDLGTASSPGNNTINVNGSGQLIQNTTPNPIPAAGDTFENNGTPLPAAATLTFTSLSASAATADFGQGLTFTASVRPNGLGPIPTGSVDFFDTTTSTDLGSATLSASGTASLTTAPCQSVHSPSLLPTPATPASSPAAAASRPPSPSRFTCSIPRSAVT